MTTIKSKTKRKSRTKVVENKPWDRKQELALLAAIDINSTNKKADFEAYALQLKAAGEERTVGSIQGKFYELTRKKRAKANKAAKKTAPKKAVRTGISKAIDQNSIFAGEVRMDIKSIKVKDGQIVFTF